MGDLVNLRQARKRAARAASERKADENRVVHSVSARERKAREADRSRVEARHEAHRLESPGEEG